MRRGKNGIRTGIWIAAAVILAAVVPAFAASGRGSLPAELPERAVWGVWSRVALPEIPNEPSYAAAEAGKAEAVESSAAASGTASSGPVTAGIAAAPTAAEGESAASEGGSEKSSETAGSGLLQAEEGEKSLYVAHTGRSGKAAQNSLLAFQRAGEAGYWAIETDIRWTSDHVIICYHDEAFDAHSDGTGLVEDCSWDYVKTLHVSAGNTEPDGPQPIATFAEYLDTCKEYGRQALVDVKYCSLGYEDMISAAYDMVVERDMLDRTIWQCSLGDYLRYIKSLNPDARCWLLCSEGMANDPDMIVHARADLDCEGINVPVIKKKVAKLAHENGMICVFYQTDKRKKQKKCFRYGYDLVMENGLH